MMRRDKKSRREVLIVTLCVGLVTGALLRLITTATSGWLYTLTAGFLIGLATSTLLVWVFLTFSQPFSKHFWTLFNRYHFHKFWLRGISIGLGLAIIATYMVVIYTAARGRYPEAIVTTLFFLLLLFLGTRLSLSTSPPPHDNILLSLLLSLFIASYAGGISLIGGVFGLLLAGLVLLLDPLLPLLADYWLLSGIFYGAMLGAITGAKL
jgi:hypothetical protein